MKILVVADRFFPNAPGGLARVAWDVAKALVRRGHTVHLVAAELTSDAVLDFATMVDGVHVHLFSRPVFSAWHPRRMGVPVALFARTVGNVLAQEQFDAIHFHSIYTGMAVLRAIRGRVSRPGLVYTIHSPVAQEQRVNWSRQGFLGVVNNIIGLPLVRRLERKLILSADATHVLSHFSADELAKEHPRLTGRYRVIPHFVYHDWGRHLPQQDARARLGWPLHAKTLFTVRRLAYRYGIDDAIAAVAPLAAAGRCVLRIAGDGPDRQQLQRIIDGHGCSDTITLMGQVTDETLQLAYRAANLFLLPTRQLECFGLISLEAMSLGLPVLGTSVGAIPEVIRPILPEFLTPPGNPTAFRDKVEAYLDGRLEPPSEEVIVRYVQDTYSELSIMARYEKMYEDVLTARAGNIAGGRA